SCPLIAAESRRTRLAISSLSYDRLAGRNSRRQPQRRPPATTSKPGSTRFSSNGTLWKNSCRRYRRHPPSADQGRGGLTGVVACVGTISGCSSAGAGDPLSASRGTSPGFPIGCGGAVWFRSSVIGWEKISRLGDGATGGLGGGTSCQRRRNS